MDATSGGRPTVRRLDRRLNTCKASSLPSMFEGIGPKSPIAGSRSSRTRFPSGVHVTPTQDVQTWVVRVQLIFFPCGRDAANARRACLSEFRSAPLVQGRSGNKREAERKAISLRCCIVRMARRTRRTRTTITQGSPSVLQSSEEKKKHPTSQPHNRRHPTRVMLLPMANQNSDSEDHRRRSPRRAGAKENSDLSRPREATNRPLAARLWGGITQPRTGNRSNEQLDSPQNGSHSAAVERTVTRSS